MSHTRALSSHVSLRLPSDLIEAFDKLAAALDRPRSWVMVRALRSYLEEEGAEIFDDVERLVELDREGTAPFEDSLRRVRQIIDKAKAERAHSK